MSEFKGRTAESIPLEMRELRDRLREAEETIAAIRSGEVDAIAVSGPEGDRVYTLESADQVYRFLIEQMNEGAATTTPDGTILFCNSNFAKLTGVAAINLVGQPIRTVLEPDQLPQFDALFREGAEGSSRGELWFAHRGSRIPVYLSINALDLGSNQVISLLATDLSDQKRNERTVARGRLANSILDNMAEATVVCDPDGTIIRASRVTAELCGGNPLRHRFEELFPLWLGPDSGRFRLSDVRARATTSQDEALYRRSDGKEFSVLLSAGVLRDEEERNLGWVVTLTDITERKAWERRLEELNRQLVAAKQEADAGNQAKSAFLDMVSHELRTPLNQLYLQLELQQRLLRGALNEKQTDGVTRVWIAMRRLTRLVDSVLEYSRVQSERLKVHPLCFDVAELVAEACADVQEEARQQGIEVVFEAATNMPALLSDPSLVAIIVHNLLDNAIKYTPDGKISARVASAAEGVVIEVADTGQGISEEFQTRMFEPFEQAEDIDRKHIPGVGLGLALVKEITEVLGGRISVETILGQGSVFTIELPPCKRPSVR